jgi:hypothetical protein
MGRRLPLIALSAAALLTAACGGAKAQVLLPDSQPLAMPSAPAHVVVPAPLEPQVAPVVDIPVVQAAPPLQSGGSRPVPPPATKPVTTPAPPPTTPPAPAPSAPTPLEAAPNQSELEQRARGLVASAEKALDRIDVKLLSEDARGQYQTARRFLKQADDALKVKNIVYAWQLAEKANNLAIALK